MALPEARVQGRAAITRAVAAIMRAVPDCAVDVAAVARGEGVVTLEWTFSGTQAGDLPGLPASGRPIALPGVSACRMAGDLIREERVYWDAATLITQAGHLGEGPGPPRGGGVAGVCPATPGQVTPARARAPG